MKNTNIKKYQEGGENTINPYRMPFSLFGDAGSMLGSIMAPIGATGSGFSERKTLGRNEYVLNWMKENNYEFAGRDWLGRQMVLNKTTGKKERASDIGAPSDTEYTAYSQGNELFNKFLPLTQNMAGLFDLQQKERQELENKKDTVQDFPTNTSTYAPVGFMQDGGGTDPLYEKFPALKSIQSLPKGMSKKHKDMVLSAAFNETQQIAKDMMMQEIQSATYLDRLRKLFPNGAEREQQERLQNLQNTGTKFINFSPDENGYSGLYTPKDFSGKPLVEVTIPGVEPTTFFHEYGHASNKANLAPQEKSYIEKSLKSTYNPVELHAELGQLRQLAKILGVDNFDTNNISSDDVDALESALKNRNDNTSKKNLSVLQRLKKVTKDQNTLPDLFNTIAYNNTPDKLPIARDGGLFISRTGKILYGGGDLDNLKDEISLDELNKAKNDKIELINYINSDSYANRILNYAPPKIQKNPSKASEFVDEFRSRSLLGLDIPVMVGITDGAGEFKESNIVVSKDYKNDFSNVVKHESGHAYTDPLRELQTGFIFANTKPYNNEVKSSPYAKGVNNRDDWNFVVETEAPAVAHTIRAKMKEFFNIPLGTEITADQYNEFIQEVNSNPEKYKFEKSQIDYLKTMAKNEASELNLINKLASSGNSEYMATMAKNGGFFQKLGKGIGNVFKGVGNVAHDWGLGVADSFGNRLGIYDIDNSKYKTNFGKDVSGLNDKLQSVTGKIGMAVASAAVPGLSGLSGLSGMAGGFNVPNNQQQYSPQQAVGMPSDFQILMGGLPRLLSGLQSPTQSNYTGFFKNGGNSQQVLGYKDISPYKNLPSQIINSNNITMDGVSRTLKLIPDVGQPVVAKGNSGNYIFPGARRVLEVPVAQDGLRTSHQDSIAHQANKILKYEQLKGGPGGAPLPSYADPKYLTMLMQHILPEVNKIMPNASAIEKAEAMDFIFNAGWDKNANKITKDPRAYALQEYYRKYDNSKLDKDNKWAGRKNPAYSFDEEYANTIGKLSENERRILMNKGRDWYYQNINNPSPGVPSPDYESTWYGRIWNTNDYNEFDPNSIKLVHPNKRKPQKKVNGGQPTNNNEEMIMGVIEMLQSVEDLNNRERMAIQKLQELKQEGIDIDEEDFMEAVMEEDYDDDVSPEDFDDDSFEVEDEIEEMKDGGMPQRYKDMGFSKVDTPRRTPKHKTKSHAVVIKDGGKYKLIRFGQQGVSGSPKRKGESKADANRRKSFKARHAKNISKGKTSAAFWSSRIKW